MIDSEKNNIKNQELITPEQLLLITMLEVLAEYIINIRKKYETTLPLVNFFSELHETLSKAYDETPVYFFEPFNSDKKPIEKFDSPDMKADFNFSDLINNKNQVSEKIKTLGQYKDLLTPDEYCFICGIFWLNELQGAKGMLSLRNALYLSPENATYFLFYNFLHATEINETTMLLKAVKDYPAETSIKGIKETYLFGLIKAFYNIFDLRNKTSKKDLEILLSHFPQNKILLYTFLHSLKINVDSGEILNFLPIAFNHSPKDNSLKALEALLLYNTGNYEAAYRIALNIDILNLDLNTDEILELQVMFADLMRLNGDKGKALLELYSIIQDEEYKESLSDAYYKACLISLG